MSRNRFVRKWLGNKNYPYTDENRGLMLDDLDKVIEQALNKHFVSNNEVAVCDCPKLHAVNRVCTYCKKIVPKSKYRKQTDC